MFYLDLASQKTINFYPQPIDVSKNPINVYDANFIIESFKLDIIIEDYTAKSFF